METIYSTESVVWQGGGGVFSFFPVHKGVRQGCVLAPPLSTPVRPGCWAELWTQVTVEHVTNNHTDLGMSSNISRFADLFSLM